MISHYSYSINNSILDGSNNPDVTIHIPAEDANKAREIFKAFDIPMYEHKRIVYAGDHPFDQRPIPTEKPILSVRIFFYNPCQQDIDKIGEMVKSWLDGHINSYDTFSRYMRIYARLNPPIGIITSPNTGKSAHI